MKRFLFSMIMLCALLCTTAMAATFEDVPESHWAYEYVERSVEAGWVQGTSATTFEPDSNVTYAEFIVMIMRTLDAEVLAYQLANWPTPNPWWERHYSLAQSWNILGDTAVYTEIGTSTTSVTATMNSNINRYEMAQLIYNTLDNALRSDTVLDTVTSYDATLLDMDQVPEQYVDAVTAMFNLYVLEGTTEGTFDGSAYMTRAQAVAVLCRQGDVRSLGTSSPFRPRPSTVDEDAEIVPGQILSTLSPDGYSIYQSYTPCSNQFTGWLEGGVYGAYVSSLEEMVAVLEEIAPEHPTTIYFFADESYWTTSYDPDGLITAAIQNIYEGCPMLSDDGSYSDVADYEIRSALSNTVMSSGDNFTAGDYYEYCIRINYSATWLLNRYINGELDGLPSYTYGSTLIDYEPLLEAYYDITDEYNLTANSSEIERFTAIYRYITDNISYSYAVSSKYDLVDAPVRVNAALIYKIGICSTYARLLDALCDLFDIESLYVAGSSDVSDEGHAWNYVQIDGQWYQADSTWDAGKSVSKYEYFLISDAEMGKNHMLGSAALAYGIECPDNYN